MAFKDTSIEAQRRTERWGDRKDQLGGRLSTWLLVGNAAALLLCFNGLLDHKVCDWPVFRPLVSAFAVGLAASFLAPFFAWLASASTHRDLSHLLLLATRAELMEAEFARMREAGELTDGAMNDFEATNTEIRTASANVIKRGWRSAAAELSGAVASVVAVAALVFGLVAAVADPTYAAAVCPR
jgi:hypothetical protein